MKIRTLHVKVTHVKEGTDETILKYRLDGDENWSTTNGPYNVARRAMLDDVKKRHPDVDYTPHEEETDLSETVPTAAPNDLTAAPLHSSEDVNDRPWSPS